MKAINIIIGICLIIVGSILLYDDKPATWGNLAYMAIMIYGAMIIINPILKKHVYGTEEKKDTKIIPGE